VVAIPRPELRPSSPFLISKVLLPKLFLHATSFLISSNF
jgi:hypothetical protein